jgi:hypothetical protein
MFFLSALTVFMFKADRLSAGSVCNIGVHAGGANPGAFRFLLNTEEPVNPDTVSYYLPVVESLSHGEETCPYGNCSCGVSQKSEASVRWVPVDQYNASAGPSGPPPIAPAMLRSRMGYSQGSTDDLVNPRVQAANVFKIGSSSSSASAKLEAIKLYQGLKQSYNKPSLYEMYRGLISATMGSSQNQEQVDTAFSRYEAIIKQTPAQILNSKPAALEAFRNYFVVERNR